MHAVDSERLVANPSTARKNYRPDIDGLRAISVAFVVAYHAFPGMLKGGFIGVDVFFVISGYLITSIIIEGIGNGSFSFAGFYARRLRRIFPALIVVMAACLAAGWLFLLSDEYRLLGKHIAAGAAFISNLIYIRESGYFDVAARRKVLLHLWSLGVEEQYYIFWPAIVYAAYRSRMLGTATAAIIVGSFLYNLHSVATYPPDAFYSPLSRAWELLAGAMLAHAQLRWREEGAEASGRFGAADWLAALGMILLVYSALSLSSASKFPGWAALEPVSGTVLIIASGPQAWINRTVLANPVLVFLGLISYPLYLWHWPLLVFAADIDSGLSALVRLFIVAASIFAAWLTHILVEKPIRFHKAAAGRPLILAGAMIVCGLCGFCIYAWAPANMRPIDRATVEYGSYFEHLDDHHHLTDEYKAVFNFQCGFYNQVSSWNGHPTNKPLPSIDPSCYTPHSPRSVMLWGDSFAADLYSGLKATLPKGISTLLVWSAGCQIERVHTEEISTDHCQKMNDFGLSVIARVHPSVVVLSSSRMFDIQYLRELMPVMKQNGVRRVLVLSQAPIWDDYLYKIIIRYFWNFTPRRILGHLDEVRLVASRGYPAQLRPDDQFIYVDLMSLFCNSRGCLTYLGDDRKTGLYTLDDAHFRPAASAYVARKLLVPRIMEAFERTGGG